jgi:hypothetical protein
LDITYKKKSLTYLEQDPEKVEEFKELLENLPEGTPIVYLDESGIKQEVTREGFFQQLLESFVPFEWVKEIDFEHCELLDKTFISKEYEKRESDVI